MLVIASGRNRVDEGKLSEFVAEPVRPAEPEFVRQRTGFAIGGVPPVGHPEEIETFLDEDLMTLDEIWAAAGAPDAVFCIRSADLVAIAGGRVVRIAEKALSSSGGPAAPQLALIHYARQRRDRPDRVSS